MSTPFLRLRTERLSRRANSITRASSLYCFAHAIDSAEGCDGREIDKPALRFGNDLMFDDEDVSRLQPLAVLSQRCEQLVCNRVARADFFRESDRDESNLANFART